MRHRMLAAFVLFYAVGAWAVPPIAEPLSAGATAHIATSGKEAGQPLLPQPPKHAVPMVPLLPGAPEMPADLATGSDSQARGDEYMGQLSVYSAELTVYAGMLNHMITWLAVCGCICVLALLAIVMYLRRIAVHSVYSAHAMRLNADSNEQLIAHGKEVATKKLRAYIFTNGAKGELLASKNFTVRIEVKNFGATPAYHLNGWMGVYVDDLANERNVNAMPDDFQTVETILPPGGVCYYYAQTSYQVSSELKAIGASQKAIFAYGEIRYRDVFDQSHYVKFKIKCSGERNLASGSFDHCMEGNESD